MDNVISILVPSLVIISCLTLVGMVMYAFYLRNIKKQKEVSDYSDITDAINTGMLDISDDKDFAFKKAVAILGTDTISKIVDEEYSTVSVEMFLRRFQEKTRCSFDVINGEYSYGTERVKLLLGQIGTEKFLMYLQIGQINSDPLEKDAINYLQLKPFIRKRKLYKNENENQVEEDVNILGTLTKIRIFCLPQSLHIKSNICEEAKAYSRVIYKKREQKPNEAFVYTLAFDGRNNELSLRPMRTQRFNYDYQHLANNYEDIQMDILGHKASLSITDCLEYCKAAILNGSNCMINGMPGVGKTVFSTAIITELSKYKEDGKNRVRVILLDANNIEKLQDASFANAMREMANDNDDDENQTPIINLFYMEDAEALFHKSFDKNGDKTSFGSFMLSMLSGTYQKLYNMTFLVTSNDAITEYNEIMRRRFTVVMPVSELSMEKADKIAKEVSENSIDPIKNAFNWAIWSSIKVRKGMETGKYTLSEIYSCIQPITQESKFMQLQKQLLEKAGVPDVIIPTTIPVEIVNKDKVIVNEDVPKPVSITSTKKKFRKK
jgi:DNA replication protein DnaC